MRRVKSPNETKRQFLARRKAEIASRSVTYAIVTIGRPRVKIGKSTNVKARLRDLQTAAPDPLAILGTIPGDREEELHARFAKVRLRGEWFRLTRDILKVFQPEVIG